MKKIILPIFFLFLSSVSQADSLNLNTILKPPINTFSRLQLVPRTVANPTACPRGTVFLDAATRDVLVCTGSNTFENMHSPWTQNGNIIYLRDWATPEVNVGIGTQTPRTKFEVSNDTLTTGVYNSFQIETKNAQENLGINIITRGVPSAATGHWASFINFINNNSAPNPAAIGRIIYTKRPWGRTGLGIASDALANFTSPNNIYDIWMDAGNRNVGIGLGVVPATLVQDFAQPPAQKLEVKNGNLRANRVYLTAPNGTQTAELRAVLAPGGYYAVLAP